MRDDGGGEDTTLRSCVEGGGGRAGGVPEAPCLSSNDCSRYDGWLRSSFVRNLRAFFGKRLGCGGGENPGPSVAEFGKQVRGWADGWSEHLISTGIAWRSGGVEATDNTMVDSH